LGALRRQESDKALASLGVRAFYGNLPDGGLHEVEHQVALENHIVSMVRDQDIRMIATLGLRGYCGHDDHVAAHHAALAAQKRLAVEDGARVPILALNHNHQGALKIPVDSKAKIAALAMHESQFGFLSELDRLPPTHAIYHSLFSLETYDVVLPGDEDSSLAVTTSVDLDLKKGFSI
jgi:LmbE family N-acetylglucosaminyl deacetylase